MGALCLPQKRIFRKVSFERLAIARHDPDRHFLILVWRVAFDNDVVRDVGAEQFVGQTVKFVFVVDGECDGECSLG